MHAYLMSGTRTERNSRHRIRISHAGVARLRGADPSPALRVCRWNWKERESVRRVELKMCHDGSTKMSVSKRSTRFRKGTRVCEESTSARLRSLVEL